MSIIPFFLNNWKAIAAVLALAAAFSAGWLVNGWKHEAERAKALDDLIAEQEANYQAAVSAEAERLSRQRDNERETETVIKEVTRYVKGKCDGPVLGPDGARALNRLRK